MCLRQKDASAGDCRLQEMTKLSLPLALSPSRPLALSPSLGPPLSTHSLSVPPPFLSPFLPRALPPPALCPLVATASAEGKFCLLLCVLISVSSFVHMSATLPSTSGAGVATLSPRPDSALLPSLACMLA